MAKRQPITREQIAELEEARRTNKHKRVEKRLEAILMHANGEKHSVISEKTDFCKEHVSRLVSKYRRQGISAIVENHYGGNHRNLSFAEEEALLAPFKEAAEAGQIIEVSEIKRAYEAAVGRSFERSNSQIYCVLARHGWRKVMPRSRHPKKASDEVIETSKKLTLESKTQGIM